MGVDHVICVNKCEEIDDDACIEFSSLFYRDLFSLIVKEGECAICRAFEKAKNDVMYKNDAWGLESEKFLLFKSKKVDCSLNRLSIRNLRRGKVDYVKYQPQFELATLKTEHFIGRHS